MKHLIIRVLSPTIPFLLLAVLWGCSPEGTTEGTPNDPIFSVVQQVETYGIVTEGGDTLRSFENWEGKSTGKTLYVMETWVSMGREMYTEAYMMLAILSDGTRVLRHGESMVVLPRDPDNATVRLHVSRAGIDPDSLHLPQP